MSLLVLNATMIPCNGIHKAFGACDFGHLQLVTCLQ